MQRQLDVGRLTVARMAPSELGAAAVVVTRAFAGTPEAQSLRDIRQAVSRAVSKAVVSLSLLLLLALRSMTKLDLAALRATRPSHARCRRPV